MAVVVVVVGLVVLLCTQWKCLRAKAFSLSFSSVSAATARNAPIQGRPPEGQGHAAVSPSLPQSPRGGRVRGLLMAGTPPKKEPVR